MPVLQNIQIKTNDNTIIRQIDFNTSYKLRPNSAWTFVRSGVDPNSNKAILTLNSLLIRDATGTITYPVRFDYVNNNPSGPARKSNSQVPYFIEERDLWGYYSPNATSINNFNEGGLESRASLSDAWSLNKIRLPQGLTITWEYEPNRYDAANGKSVSSTTLGDPKFGGGIRVKKIIYPNGIGRTDSISCFYTNTPGVFGEHLQNGKSNCSGHATVEPYNYISSTDYRTELSTRGGYYTPAGIIYEIFQVVKNYSVSNPKPFGYTVYTMSTSADHPNSGTYGEVDSSWTRGFITSVSEYNKIDQLVSSVSADFDFVVGGMTDGGFSFVKDGNTEIVRPYRELTTGYVRTKNVHSLYLNVKKTKTNVFADELADVKSAPGRVTYRIPEWDVLKSPEPEVTTTDLNVPANSAVDMMGGSTIPCHSFGESGKLDLLVVTAGESNGTSGVSLRLLKDLTFDSKKNTTGKWSSKVLVYKKNVNPLSSTVLGAGLYNDNNNADPDILVLCREYNTPTNTYYLLKITDLKLTSSESGNDVLTFGSVVTIPFSPSFQVSDITSASFGSFSGTGAIDMVTTFRTRESWGNDIAAYTGFQPSTSTFLKNYPSASLSLRYIASNSQLVDYDEDGNTNDLLIFYLRGINSSFSVVKNVRIQNGQLIGDVPGAQFDNWNYYVSLLGNKRYSFAYLGKDYLFDLIFTAHGNLFDNTQGMYILPYNKQIIRDYVGIPYKTIETNSDDQQKVTTNIPAFFNYNQMQTKNMLTQQCQKVISSGNTTIVGSSATAWPIDGNMSLPFANYAWKTNLTPGVQPPDFNFQHPELSGNQWVLTDSIGSYNSFCQPIETAVPNGGASRFYNTTVYNNKNHLPIASVINAKFDECAIFTCDYDCGVNPDCFDKENGWEKGGAIFSSSMWHFGEGSVHVYNTFGPTKNVKFDPNKNYVFSAWFYRPLTGEVTSTSSYAKMAVELHSNIPNGSVTQIGSWDMVYTDLPYGNCFKEYTLKSVDLQSYLISGKKPSDIKYVRIWIGNGPGETPADFYIDDIRFYPSNALVSTTYYNYLGLPTLSLDANNNPGHRITYDGFGRVVKEDKIDKTKSVGDDGYATTLMEKEYHLMGPLVEPGIPSGGYPNYVVTVSSPWIINLTWNCDNGDLTDVKYDLYIKKNAGPYVLHADLTELTFPLNVENPPNSFEWYVIAKKGNLKTTGPVWIFLTKL